LVDHTGRKIGKVVFRTASNVFPHNRHMIVAFGGALHVKETKSVHELMKDRAVVNATETIQVQLLGAPNASYERPATITAALKILTYELGGNCLHLSLQ
jgi:hypothetical protein